MKSLVASHLPMTGGLSTQIHTEVVIWRQARSKPCGAVQDVALLVSRFPWDCARIGRNSDSCRACYKWPAPSQLPMIYFRGRPPHVDMDTRHLTAPIAILGVAARDLESTSGSEYFCQLMSTQSALQSMEGAVSSHSSANCSV